MTITYPYRVYSGDTFIIVNMTPAKAAHIGYSARVEPVDAKTPAAPGGQLERGYPVEAWRPR